MYDYPKTLEEARSYKYGSWAGDPDGNEYKEGLCADEVYNSEPGPSFSQCLRKNGKGPDGLYCWQHVKKVEGS